MFEAEVRPATRWSGPQAPEQCHRALGRIDVRTPGT